MVQTLFERREQSAVKTMRVRMNNDILDVVMVTLLLLLLLLLLQT